MIVSILDEVGYHCKEMSAGEMHEFLHSRGIRVFDEIFDCMENGEKKFPGQSPKSIVMYILLAYSDDSPMVIAHANAAKEKTIICDKVGVPEVYRHMLINLEDHAIRDAVISYLEDYCSIDFRELTFLKMQRDTISKMIAQESFFKEIAEGKVERDVKGYFDALSRHDRLSEKISSKEEQLRQRYVHRFTPELTAAKNTVKEKNKVSRRGVSPEHSGWIK